MRRRYPRKVAGMRALIIWLWVSLAVMAFDFSAGLMMASGTCFAAWLEAIRSRGQA